MTAKRLVTAFLVLLFLLAAAMLVSSFFLGFEKTSLWLSQQVFAGVNKERFHAFFSASKFRTAQVCLGGLLLMLIFLLKEQRRQPNRVAGFLQQLYVQTLQTFRLLRTPEYALVIIIPFAAAVYYAATLPISSDEALTYIHFTSRNFLVSYTYYPFPNNHVLHSLCTNMTRYLPFGAVFNLRISSVLIQTAAWMIALRMIHGLYGKKTAVLTLAVASMLFLNIYYSYMSRGYALVNFATIGAMFAAYRIIGGSPNPWKWHLFSFFTILGFCAMPSFLYPFLSIHLILLWQLRKISVAQMLSGAATAVLVVLFYTPIMAINGIAALVANPYVQPISRHEVWAGLPQFIRQTLAELTGFDWMLTVPVLVISGLHILIFDPARRWVEYLLWILLLPALLLAHGVIAFPRTFIYYGFILTFFSISTFQHRINRISAKAIVLISVLSQALLWLHFNRQIVAYEERDPQINFTAARIIPQIIGPGKTYLCAGSLMGTNLLFEIKARKIQHSSVIFTDTPVNADTVKSFDHMIIGRYLDSTKHRKPRFSNFYYSVYDR